jgi:hypothetical protein
MMNWWVYHRNISTEGTLFTDSRVVMRGYTITQRQSQDGIDGHHDQSEEYLDDDDESSTASIPDEDINFDLTYAL